VPEAYDAEQVPDVQLMPAGELVTVPVPATEAARVNVGTAVTVTVVELDAELPPSVQLRVYVLVAVKAPVDWLPDRVVVPAAKPAIQEQEVALVELQVIVEELPDVTEAGEALIETVIMFTVTDLCTVPTALAQLRVYVLAAVKAPVDWLPDRVADPVKPDVQEQEVASVELQVIVVEPPEGTDV